MDYIKANEDYIPFLIDCRKMQLAEEGQDPGVNIDQELTDYFFRKMKDGSLVEYIALERGDMDLIAGTAAILFADFPPSFANPKGVRGYITNMYTSPAFRHQGVASVLLQCLVNEAKQQGVTKLFLSASEMGKQIYKRFGFEEQNTWMVLDLDETGKGN